VLDAHWPARAVQEPGGKRQRRESEAVPEGGGKLGKARGEGTGRGNSWLSRGEVFAARTPGVRRGVGVPERLDSGQEKEDKGESLRWFGQRH
jgi:hypothetical protein